MHYIFSNIRYILSNIYTWKPMLSEAYTEQNYVQVVCLECSVFADIVYAKGKNHLTITRVW